MATVTKPIALDESLNTTELSSRNVADVLAQELSAVATAISGISAPSAEDVSYDNSGSGLSATDVQNALDEIVSDIPTVNDGTLTIQQNGETKGTFTANQSGNSTVNIQTPTTDIQTAVDEFETYNGGLLSSLKVTLSPNQDLHGYENPWVGGAGKNKLTTENITTNKFLDSTGNEVDANGYSITDYLPVTESMQYCVSGTSNVNGTYLGFYDASKNLISTMQESGETFTFSTPVDTKYVRITLRNVASKNPQLEEGSTATAYEPYSNICPISGHTQVDVDVSDGQTTQEQVTVNLGGTYYSGTLDVVSGVFVPDTAGVDVSASDLINQYLDTTNNQYLAGINANAKIPSTTLTVGNVKCNELTPKSQNSLFNEVGGAICIMADGKLRVTFSGVTTFADMQTWVTNHPLQVVYELATPTPIQLSPTMVKALVGENHLSAPLDGQEITESKYKQMFTFDDVIAYIQSLS